MRTALLAQSCSFCTRSGVWFVVVKILIIIKLLIGRCLVGEEMEKKGVDLLVLG
jgi:hypothetical protein